MKVLWRITQMVFGIIVILTFIASIVGAFVVGCYRLVWLNAYDGFGCIAYAWLCTGSIIKWHSAMRTRTQKAGQDGHVHIEAETEVKFPKNGNGVFRSRRDDTGSVN